MFQRRSQKTILMRVRELFWPRKGWRRASQYLWHRLHRLPGSPYSIAAGLATGAAFSVTPFIGIHFFLAALLAWIIRANVVASVFGTLLGNPWTFPVIWLSTHQFGRFMLGCNVALGDDLNFTAMYTGLVHSMIETDATMFVEQVWPLWMPMFVGSIPSAIFTWLVVYFVFFRLTKSYQERRNVRRVAKINALRDASLKQDIAG